MAVWNITYTTRKSAAGIADIENRLVNTVREGESGIYSESLPSAVAGVFTCRGALVYSPTSEISTFHSGGRLVTRLYGMGEGTGGLNIFQRDLPPTSRL